MKTFSGVIVFLLVFLVSGALMHQALYGKAGIFVWTVDEDPASGDTRFVRTVIDPPAVAATLAEEKEPTPAAQSAAAEPAEAEKKPLPDELGEVDDTETRLFDGKALGKWKSTAFGGEGDVFVNENGELEFGFGAIMTGVTWTGEPPSTSNYEIELEAKKLDGTDFFLALTFPVKDSHATFVVGGWGGGIVGISSIDDLNASENETMNIEGFEPDRWYRVRVKVTDDKLEAWIDEDQKVDLELEGRKISLLPGDIELSAPLGIASYMTRAAYRDIVWRKLE